MDPSYDASNLRSLSAVAQKIVHAACDPKGASVVDLKRFQTLFTNAKSARDIHPLRPAFWTLLDPACIPTPLALDSPSTQTRSIVHAAHIGIAGVYRDQTLSFLKLAQNAPAHQSIWPRLWAWVEFLHRFSALVLPGISQQELLLDFVGYTSRTLGYRKCQKIAWETPGFFSILLHTWNILPDLPVEGQRRLVDYLDLNPPVEKVTLAYIDELVAGAGGTIDHLARMLQRQLHYSVTRLAAPQKTPLVRRTCLMNLMRTMDFIASFDGSISNSRAPPPDPLAPKPRMMLTAALVDRGAAKLLSRMFCILAETKPTIDDDALVDGLLLRLLDIMTLVMADSLVGCRILLRNDFLAGVFAYCRRKRPAQEKDELKVILVRALPQLSFFYSNLMLFQDAINTVDANAPQSSFRDAATYSYWVKFRELLKYQLFVLHEFNLTGFLKPRAACDNLSCGTILFKEQLRSCAGCKSRMYCSDACQREDWSSGGHRDTCVLSRRIRIAFRSDLSRKDMHYFHFLLHKLSSHDAITLEHWAAHISYEQHTTTPVLQFVYGGQDSEEIGIATRPFVSSPHDFRAAVHPSRLDPLWDDWVDRARRSKGRMDLHVIHLAAGFHDRLLIIPRRSSSSFVNDNAARLFRTVPGVATAGQGGVWKFEKEWKKLEMPKNLEVIH